MQTYKFESMTISGKVATGTTTLAKNLQKILKWRYINAGLIQRKFDIDNNYYEYEHGALIRSDQHEKQIDKMTVDYMKKHNNVIYEAWLAGYMCRKLPKVLRVLLICSNDAVTIDRVANRDNLSIDQAKKFIKIRETENIVKWQKLYGKHNFWDKKYYHIVIDTYSSGPMETVGIVLDTLGYK